MELSHTEQNLHSAAAQRLSAFIKQRQEVFGKETHNFERFEQELHLLVMALEGELVGEELSRYDLSAEEIEVEGKAYRVGMVMPETYLCAAGLVTVNRHLYHLSRCAKVFRTFPNELIIRNNLVNLVGHHTIPGGPIVPDHSQ
jgi:hypothetical protein